MLIVDKIYLQTFVWSGMDVEFTIMLAGLSASSARPQGILVIYIYIYSKEYG